MKNEMFEISANEIRVLHEKYFSQSSYFNMPMLLYHAIIGIGGCGQCWSVQVLIYKPTLITLYLWFLYCNNPPYKSLLPIVFSLSLFCVLTVLLLLFLSLTRINMRYIYNHLLSLLVL